ncbi:MULTISPECIES: hypothetical protein [Nostocales]|nr:MULTISPECIES: hypothetical protein [Nostocales]
MPFLVPLIAAATSLDADLRRSLLNYYAVSPPLNLVLRISGGI